MLRVSLLCLLLLSVFIQSGCSVKQFSDNTIQTEDEIREAVFRYYFSSRYANGIEDMDYIFLSVQNNNPNPLLLERLQDHDPAVAPISVADLSQERGIVHQSDGASQGVIFTISKIKWVSKYQVTVECQNTSSLLGVSGGLMKLKYINGQWKVVSHSLIWISQKNKIRHKDLALF
ncbi:hypothetical protein [Marinicella sp. W31]|uniref:hypothetical protein n=1 Tax=Marinicella sp. W31 TaxID=3023713 RepID=UPI0037564FC6